MDLDNVVSIALRNCYIYVNGENGHCMNGSRAHFSSLQDKGKGVKYYKSKIL